MAYIVQSVKRDNKYILKFKCPKCGVWAEIDQDQWEGRISIHHDVPECGFHETVNLKKIFSLEELK